MRAVASSARARQLQLEAARLLQERAQAESELRHAELRLRLALRAARLAEVTFNGRREREPLRCLRGTVRLSPRAARDNRQAQYLMIPYLPPARMPPAMAGVVVRSGCSTPRDIRQINDCSRPASIRSAFQALSAVQRIGLSPLAAPEGTSSAPSPAPQSLNRHRPLRYPAHPTAISCMGASRTPGPPCIRPDRHAGVRQTCTFPDTGDASELTCRSSFRADHSRLVPGGSCHRELARHRPRRRALPAAILKRPSMYGAA